MKALFEQMHLMSRGLHPPRLLPTQVCCQPVSKLHVAQEEQSTRLRPTRVAAATPYNSVAHVQRIWGVQTGSAQLTGRRRRPTPQLGRTSWWLFQALRLYRDICMGNPIDGSRIKGMIQ